MSHAIVNGRLMPLSEASVPVTDLGLLRGYGVFDFFKLVEGRPLYADAHLRRLRHSAERLRLPLEVSDRQLMQWVEKLYDVNPQAACGCRITLTGGDSVDGWMPGKPNLILTMHPLTLMTPELPEQENEIFTIDYERALPDVKSTDYLMGVWLHAELRGSGFQDVLYQRYGVVRECPRANLFAVTRQGVLLTPAEDVLPGITRSQVLQLAVGFMPVRAGEVRVPDLYEAAEVFLTSTSRRIYPIASVNGRIIGDGKPGPVARRLHEMFYAYEMSGGYY